MTCNREGEDIDEERKLELAIRAIMAPEIKRKCSEKINFNIANSKLGKRRSQRRRCSIKNDSN